MHLPLALCLLVGLASAATTSSSFCASAKSCPKSATPFCSSYLHIPAKTTTVTPTVTVTRTSIYVTGTTTTIAYTSTSTSTFIQQYSDFNTTTTTGTYTTTTTTCAYSYYGGVCTFTGSDPNPPQNKVLATPASPRPSCLASYPSGKSLSSACKCLSIATSTSTVSRGPTVTKTVVKTVTKAKSTTTAKTYATQYTTTTQTLTGTVTETSYVTTVTATVTITQNTNYLLVSGSSGEASNLVTDSDGGLGVQFSQPYGAHANLFYLGYYDETPCVLSSDGGGAPYGYIGTTGDILEFSYNSIPADQLVVCRQNTDTRQMFCKHPKGTTYNAGYVDSDLFWHIPLNDSAATAHIYADPLGASGCSS